MRSVFTTRSRSTRSEHYYTENTETGNQYPLFRRPRRASAPPSRRCVPIEGANVAAALEWNVASADDQAAVFRRALYCISEATLAPPGTYPFVSTPCTRQTSSPVSTWTSADLCRLAAFELSERERNVRTMWPRACLISSAAFKAILFKILSDATRYDLSRRNRTYNAHTKF